jgi:hypothetical protein
MIARRSFLLGAGAALIAAPSIVNAVSLMRVKPTEIIKPKLIIELPLPRVGDTVAIRNLSDSPVEIGVVTQQRCAADAAHGVQNCTDVAIHGCFSYTVRLRTEDVIILARWRRGNVVLLS